MMRVLRLVFIMFLWFTERVFASNHAYHAEPFPYARAGGFMGLNLGYCGGLVTNTKTSSIGSPLSLLDIEIPSSVTGIGRVYPENLQNKFHQAGFMIGLETGYDFKVSGKREQSWLLGWFVNGSLATTRGTANFDGEYQYVQDASDPDNPIMSSWVAFQEKLRFRSKGFWSTGFRFGPTVDRAFIYLKGGFMMSRMTVGIKRNDLSRIVVPSRVRWFPGGVVGLGIEFQVTHSFIMGVELAANLCTSKETTVAFPDLGGAILVQQRPFYGQALLTLKYKFPIRRHIDKPTATHSVYRPQW